MHDFKHIFHTVASSIAETLWPARCVGCDLPGVLLCSACTAKIPYIDVRASCHYCGAPNGHFACTECTTSAFDDERKPGDPMLGHTDFPFAAARAAASYEGVAKRLITCYKDEGERRLDELLAGLLLQAMQGSIRCDEGLAPQQATARVADWTAWADAIVPVPASPEALRKRGFDHMLQVGEVLSKMSGLPLVNALEQARRVADQRELDPVQRRENRLGSFALKRDAPPLPPHVVLIDDVFTTGATSSAAATVLLGGGAREVVIAVCARVW